MALLMGVALNVFGNDLGEFCDMEWFVQQVNFVVTDGHLKSGSPGEDRGIRRFTAVVRQFTTAAPSAMPRRVRRRV